MLKLKCLDVQYALFLHYNTNDRLCQVLLSFDKTMIKDFCNKFCQVFLSLFSALFSQIYYNEMILTLKKKPYMHSITEDL